MAATMAGALLPMTHNPARFPRLFTLERGVLLAGREIVFAPLLLGLIDARTAEEAQS